MATGTNDIEIDIYARVSRLGDDRHRSTTGQVEDCKARIEDLGARVGKVHIDSGRSAWNPRVRRPDWDHLMERLESGATGGVVVFDLARFSRRPIEGERLIAAADRGLLVLDSEDEYNLTTANGKKSFRDQLNSAAHESDRLSTRTKRGKRLKAVRGEPNNSRRPLGFETDGTTVREPEAALLRDLARRVLAGESQDAIVVELNERGVTTSTGNAWSRTSLRQVLTRHRNAGMIVHRGVVVSRLPGESILEEETWEKLCAQYAARRRGRPVSNPYLCSGQVHCGLCMHALTGRPRANMKPYPDGGQRRQYWCQPRSHKGGCGRIAVDQRELDRHVAALAIRILADPRHAAAVEASGKAAGEKRRRLEAEIEECEHLAEELAGRLGRREISLARHDAAVKPLDRQLDQLRTELDALPTIPEVDLSPESAATSLAEWRARWEAALVPERRALLRQALRGRQLVVMPADPAAPRRFDPKRVAIVDPKS